VVLAAGGGYIYWQNRPRPALETRFVQNTQQETPKSPEDNAVLEDKVTVKTPPESVNLGSLNHTYQTFNNCGPATLTMALGWFGTKVGQKELGDKMRPYQIASGDNDDKTIFTSEFVKWAKSYGFEALARPNGDINTLKKFTANGVPVVVKTYLHSNDDIGHFRIVKGYDEGKQVVIQDDSFEGPNREFAYYDFLTLWQPFHYVYIVVYTPEQGDLVEAIIGQEMDEKTAWQDLLTRSDSESKLTPDSVYPIFNKSVANYYLEKYSESVSDYESVASRLPRRMLWYQLEPILAMQELMQYEKVLSLSERILNGGNRAFSELYQIRGEIYQAQGNVGAARAEFEKAVQYNINYEPAKAALSDL
jgi:hypothetical protein